MSAILQLNNFEVFLTAVLIAGGLQLIMGLLKAGFVANYIPTNVIKGLLAAIGIILILKQIPHAFGYDKDPQDDFSFIQPDGENTFSVLIKMWEFITPGAVVISIVSLVVLLLWDKTPLKKFKYIPSSLFVVMLGVGLDQFFCNYIPYLCVGTLQMVNLPPIDTSNLAAYFYWPALASLGNYQVWLVGATIAAVASLETLLNIEAVDNLDPLKRESPPNRELVAQGIGNMVAGLFGGIPITSVVVRSSVNIQAGNATKLSAILHGVFMLVSVLMLSQLLNLIPLASLAAILLLTGYKLTKVAVFKEMYRKGLRQFIPFLVTIVAIVFTDLLIGILIGFAVSIFYLLRSNYRNPFKLNTATLHIGEVIKIDLSDEVSFLNKASVKDTLWSIPPGSKVVINATRSSFIDGDVLEVIDDFKTAVAPQRAIQLNIIGLKEKYELSDYVHFVSDDSVQFVNVLDQDVQQNLSPAGILDFLRAGNDRFIRGEHHDKYFPHQVNATSAEQNPIAVIIACIDSRTSPELVFDAGIGDLLIIRIAGNIINPDIVGSVELAVKEIGAKLVIVMGHSNCGAIKAAVDGIHEGNIGHITKKINRVITNSVYTRTSIDTSHANVMQQITWLNARNSVKELLAQSSYLESRYLAREVGVLPAYYDTSSGKVLFDEQPVSRSVA
ncbi:SulP family inorganic anion transporter [Nibrella saemangeumensis]|uniref:SulP family inorganic anion transporter n=1 Tax=Nibrella saemangeumensis TaxID=1084526 RepID=A0ABP8MH25_9BACT